MTSGISFVSLTPAIYHDWNSICNASKEAWFWHTARWLDYNLAYKPALNPVSHSFLVYHNGKAVAICPIIIHNASVDDGESHVINYPSGHGMTPILIPGLPLSVQHSIWGACLEKIDAIACDNAVKQATLWTTPLSEFGQNLVEVSRQLDELRRAGYLDTAWLTLVIDLSLDENTLRKQMRKGHRYDVKRGSNLFSTKVLFGSEVDRSLFDAYVNIHELAAGRKTRPQQTFDIMYACILEENALLTLAQYNNTYIGAAFIMLYKDGGYYASSCVHPEYINEPVGHTLQWATMCWMKDKGYRLYELGHIRCGALPHDPASEKEVRISHHERGFGGMPMMFVVAEKYYSQDYYMQVTLDRSTKYASSLLVDGNGR